MEAKFLERQAHREAVRTARLQETAAERDPTESVDAFWAEFRGAQQGG